MNEPTGADPLREVLRERLGAQYEILGLLGQGGMGSVYRARDLTLHREVAIKVIGGDVSTNAALKERFLQEARTVAKLRHPNIVTVYAAGDAGGLLYFVMELVPGESLRDLVAREGKVEPARGERILHELALALDYAHANGIVHRDVKPENILLDRETGRAMLTDFGVARALEGDGRMTGTGMILGSPRYMSPEQATGEATIDGRSDLYALALVGHEMFTGKPVVEAGNVAAMLVKHLTETPKPIAQAVPQVPEGVAVAIDRALHKDRDQRWASGREMAEVIGMAWTPMGGSSGAGSRTAALAARKKGPARGALIGGGVAIAASLFTVLALRGEDGGDPRKSYAVLPFEVQTGNAEMQWLRDGAVNMLTMALGQWSDLQVVDYERTLKLVKDAGAESRRVDLDEAQDIARRGGAGTLVMGQVSTTPDSLVVVARLYDVRSGRALNTATRATALAADPRPLFDDLARYLLDVAGGATSASVDVARATTTSITAYRAYLDGVGFLNSWRLRAADSAFRVAIAADSTFALAWHKRALALGWGDGGSAAYLESARRAVELADRLPPRQQALVQGHLALAEGTSAQMAGGTARERLKEAQRIYAELLAHDSLAAEGWYGLADAHFHDGAPGDPPADIQRRLSTALRGFHRTLAIDSTFHLAYSHLVQQYNGIASPASNVILSGDSVILVTDSAALRRVGGLPALRASQQLAVARALELTRGWVRADQDASAAHLALANSFVAAGFPDSAVGALDRAMQRPALNTLGMRLQAVTYQLLAEDARAFPTAREALAEATPARLRALPANERMSGLAMAMNAASAATNADAVDRAARLFVETDSIFPFTTRPAEPVLRLYATAQRVGITGAADAEQRRVLAAGVRQMTASDNPGLLAQIAAASGAVPYVAFLVTRDTLYSNALRRMSSPAIPQTDLEALEALAAGDTARARTIVAGFTHPDSLATARFSFAGLRAIARSEALAAVGNLDWAVRYLEAISPARFANISMVEPGFAAYTRSFATRARLYEDLGRPADAIRAYEEFLRRTELGGEAIEPQRREVRTALQRLRDAGR